ncbi:enolase-phosphatase E1-like isoform X2 [Varroa destructor]|nr:enolase-phosphatase E1-like isoform X2 [Varroa destructor]
MEESAVKYILLDIEGTVLPISFVKDILFAYVREHLEKFLEESWLGSDVQQAIEDIQEFSKTNPESPLVDKTDKKSVIKNVFWQMDRDLKTAGLKTLQGLIWFAGYQKHELVANLYEDVYPALKKWNEKGIKIGIYSSGSIFAQRLLFEHTQYGSLLDILDSFHDLTTAGSKSQPSSYTAIAKRISCPVKHVLFLTDVYEEYIAARTAGMQAAVVFRSGNKLLSKEEKQDVKLISTFEAIAFC